MEPDGKTRLYYYDEQPKIKVLEAAPNEVNWNDQHWITGQEAKDIYKRADFFCVNVEFGDHYKKHGYSRKYKHIWSVHIPGQGSGRWFEVRRIHGHSDQDYLDLIRKLERRTHKKGLTVLIS